MAFLIIENDFKNKLDLFLKENFKNSQTQTEVCILETHTNKITKITIIINLLNFKDFNKFLKICKVDNFKINKDDYNSQYYNHNHELITIDTISVSIDFIKKPDMLFNENYISVYEMFKQD